MKHLFRSALVVSGLLSALSPTLASANEFSAVRCKEWPATEVAHRLYTNFNLERTGGKNHDRDCRDVFYDLMRDRDPRPARLVYELKEKDLFPTIEEALAVAKANGAKIEIKFSIPEEGEPNPEDLTDIEIFLRARPQ